MIKNILLATAAMGLLAACSAEQGSGGSKETSASNAVCTPADIVLTNGTVYTVNDNNPSAEAIAIKDSKFIYVGDNGGAERYACGDANVIDLAGKAVYPGFIESHGHISGVGFREVNLNLQGINSLAEMLAAVKEYADANPDQPWIVGRGWIEKVWPEKRFPTRQDLDEIVPDRPVYLTRADGHASVINTVAMNMAEITGQSENPVGGHINLDENGEPTGMLIDTAMRYVRPLIPAPTSADVKRAIQAGTERNVKLGWTGFQNAGSSWESFNLMKELRDEGKLAHRIYDAMGYGDSASKLVADGAIIDPEHYLTVRDIKIVMDGALGSRGAAFIEPYADYDTRGLMRYTPEEILPLLEGALKAGIQIETHAIGDDANRKVLDAYEMAFNNVPKSQRKVNDVRWRIEHAQNVQPDDVDRFIDLDVLPSMQPSHAIGDLHFAEDRLGLERLKNAYLWRVFIDKGAIIPGGSDQPVEIGDPRIEFYAAIARKDLNGFSAQGWHPEYAVTREEALKMLTIWGAYAAFQEDALGSIEMGKLADLVVFDKDLMVIPEDQIMSSNAVLTIVHGDIKHQQ
ncbi:amidohydrolase [Pseudemcibacter aquimaris]|uniref:amidohydrolase n=1 Tax=Pseudemcibacter aquimaris TaxID=2857064 RepID=UPI0020117C9E|nr:amidohydrolase [Pseudemcibacter aquimaris]MCC3860149.1 amidohydrolase [Pseudemcibacter aquimaris]WDU57477.1 amidohydrolase [Pseudemcibacter aquimaris]